MFRLDKHPKQNKYMKEASKLELSIYVTRIFKLKGRFLIRLSIIKSINTGQPLASFYSAIRPKLNLVKWLADMTMNYIIWIHEYLYDAQNYKIKFTNLNCNSTYFNSLLNKKNKIRNTS